MTEQMLINDLNILKPGYRARILGRLWDDAVGGYRTATTTVVDTDIAIEAVGKTTACELCTLM
jgi:hypothetical protein